MAVSCALNTKWSHKDKFTPFTPQDFLPKTPEQQEKFEKQLAKLETAQQKIIAGQMNAMVRALKTKTDGQK